MATYIALLRKERTSDYGVSFPDVPGCVTAGRTLEEARTMAVEALSLHLEGLIEEGEALPQGSSLDAIMADPDHHDGVPFLVEAKLPDRAVRLNITIADETLRMIDEYVQQLGTSRSAFLARAALDKIEGSPQRLGRRPARVAVMRVAKKKRLRRKAGRQQ